MGGLTRLIVFVSIFASIALISEAQNILPIFKHEPSKQYYTTLNIGSAARSPVNLLLDLGTNLTWLNCRKIKSLSSLRLVTCQSSTCKSIPGSGCDGQKCLYRQPNPLGKNPVMTTGRVVQDKSTFFTTDGRRKPLSEASLRRFTFSCAVPKYLQGIAPPIAGVMALYPEALPFWRQVTSAFNIIPKFALCLPSSGSIGHLYMGAIDRYINPPLRGNIPVPRTLTLMDFDSGKGFLSVTSIYVDGVPLMVNTSTVEVRAQLSTVVPYTVLQTDIYNALASAFTRKATKIGMIKIPGHAPFKHCFKGSNMDVSVIEIGLPGNGREVKWSFQGANTMVRVSESAVCFAFVDGGKKLNEPMVIGTHQLQNYIIEFDFGNGRLAFSESLLLHNSSCSTWPSQN